MSIFSIYDIASLQGKVQLHNNKVLADDLQPYNDVLFKMITDEVTARKDDLIDSIQSQIRDHIGRVGTVTVPLWSYNTRLYKIPKHEYESALDKLSYRAKVERRREEGAHNKVCEDNGWHWTVGVSSAYSPRWDNEDGSVYTEHYWTFRPVPVDLVFRKTDLLHRLSNAFSSDFWVLRTPGPVIYEDDRCVIRRMNISANFYPGGVRQRYQREFLRTAAEKYSESYTPYDPGFENVPVLTGPGLRPRARYVPVLPIPVPEVPPTRVPATCDCDGFVCDCDWA